MSDPTDRQRLDKWLWFARVVKTRAMAQDLAESGRVRLNGRKVDASAQPVRPGDVLTVGLGQRVRVYRVTGLAARRGSYPDALRLYEDLSPEPQPRADGGAGTPDAPGASESPGVPDAPVPVRGAGRPTKRDRRRLDRSRPED